MKFIAHRISGRCSLLAVVVTWLFGIVFFAGCSHPEQTRGYDVSYGDLLGELTNVNALALAPRGTANLFSSYDRTGGNRDWGSYARLPVKGGMKTVFEADGPGVIHRIWMTGQYPDKWYFFFDGEKKPRIAGIDAHAESGDGYMHAFAKLQNMESGGYTSYVPIPFNRHIRIAVPVDFNPRQPYYQINWEKYPDGISVESFPKKFSDDVLLKIDAVRDEWDNLDARLREVADRCGKGVSTDISPGQSFQWLKANGSGTIKALRLKIDRSGRSVLQNAKLLRDLVLKIYWDGSSNPSVNVPVGDFFNNAFQYRRFSSLALGRVGDDFICRFPMPFKKSARIELVNQGDMDVKVSLGQMVATNAVPDVVRYFHAAWHQSPRYTRPWSAPHEVLKTNGSGHLVALYLNAIGMEPNWFILEGDDLVYRDNETKPSLHGTGLEDCFNGAWYYFGLSDLAYAGLLEKAAMRTAQYRYFFPDKIDFKKSLRFDFEFGHVLGSSSAPNTSKGYMSSTVYWYQDEPVGVYKLPPAAQRYLPIDPLREYTIMAELIELEHIGHFDEARDRTAEYADIYRGKPTGEIMALRLVGYDIRDGKVKNPAAAISNVLAQCKSHQALAEGRNWLSIYTGSNKALLHVDTSCAFDCYLDGRKVVSGNNPRILHTVPVALSAGEHSLVIAVKSPGRVNHPWLEATIQMADTNLNFTTEWDMNNSLARITGRDIAAARWKTEKTLPFYHPRQENWAMQPNSFVGIQSQPMLRVDRKALSASPGKHLCYRKTFTVERIK